VVDFLDKLLKWMGEVDLAKHFQIENLVYIMSEIYKWVELQQYKQILQMEK